MRTEARRDIFQAIADPTRREIIQVISAAPMTVSAVTQRFSISQSAVSQQIKILVACGVVTVTQSGRERLIRARLDSLKPVAEWIGQYEQYWNEKFDSLEHFLSTKEKPAKRTKKKK